MALAAILMAPAFAMAQTGNGAPNGAHYNLNIIGTKEKNGDMTGGGNVIFVKLWGADTRINLVKGDDFVCLRIKTELTEAQPCNLWILIQGQPQMQHTESTYAL